MLARFQNASEFAKAANCHQHRGTRSVEALCSQQGLAEDDAQPASRVCIYKAQRITKVNTETSAHETAKAMTEKRKEPRRKERRAPKRGVTVRHDDDTKEKQTPKRVRRGASKKAPVKVATPAPKVKNGADKPTVSITDAFTPPESSYAALDGVVVHAAHAETVQAVENKNPDLMLHVKHDGTALSIARLAWAEVKGVGDPEFDQCVPPHRDKFLSHAREILKGSAPQSGDTQLARFEQAVSRLNKEN